jgi:cytoskeletal protein CcmA (bactofilin family)
MFGREKGGRNDGVAVAAPPMAPVAEAAPERPHVAAAPATTESVFGPTLVFKGEINFQDAIRIEGLIQGKVTGEGRVIIAQRGKVMGDIMAAQIIVEGTVQGNITAADRLEITGTAQVAGDLRALRLTIAEGAKIVGRLDVDSDSLSIQAPSAAPEGEKAPSRSGDALDKVF